MMYILQWPEQSFTAIAQVCLCADPEDVLLWETQFMPVQIEDGGLNFQIQFNASGPECLNGAMGLPPGVYQITVEIMDDSESLDSTGNTLELRLNNNPIETFTANDQVFTTTIAYPTEPNTPSALLTAFQPNNQFIAYLRVIRTHAYNEQGVMPEIKAEGAQLKVSYTENWGNPRPGTLTARARLYDIHGEERAVSNDLLLSIDSA